jgi:hypothetical protein
MASPQPLCRCHSRGEVLASAAAQRAHSFNIRTYVVEPFCITRTCFACGSMVRYDHMFVVSALCERKNDKRAKRKYRSAEGSARQLRKSYNILAVRITRAMKTNYSSVRILSSRLS